MIGDDPKLNTPGQKSTPPTYLITDSLEDLTSTVEPDDETTPTANAASHAIKLLTTSKVAILTDRSMSLVDPADIPHLWELQCIDDASAQGLTLATSTIPDSCRTTVVTLVGPHPKLTTVRALVEQIERLYGIIITKQLKFKIMGACISPTTPIETRSDFEA